MRLAQISPASVEVRDDRVLGVRLPLVQASLEPFHISYGPGGTAASMDSAARSFAGLIPELLKLASQETAIRNLHRALQRTSRTLNALKDVLLPELEADLRSVAAGLEEEERDERARWSRRRDVNLRLIWMITLVLLGLGLLGTFSPFFELFAPEE